MVLRVMYYQPVPRLLTNFFISDIKMYEDSIREFEEKYPEQRGIIGIKDEAYDDRGQLLPGDKALWLLKDTEMYDAFWEIFWKKWDKKK